MGNERLRSQLKRQNMTTSELAEQLEVDPKTVSRWLQSGRMPHQRHRARTSEVLDTAETFLWPELLDTKRSKDTSRSEILEVYPHRGAVPHDLWRRLIEKAETNVDVLVFAGLFLIDSNPDLPQRLVDRGREGLQARLTLGDPDSPVTARRGEEEGIGDDLAARIRLSLRYLQPAQGKDGVDVRQHETVLYNSIYRFDDEMLVNTHVIGSPAGLNPVLHIQRIDGGHLFDHYLSSFERVWESARPAA
jgi:excisionase family DNA binding protein